MTDATTPTTEETTTADDAAATVVTDDNKDTALGGIAEPEKAADDAGGEDKSADDAEKADEKPSIIGAPEAYDFTGMKLPEGQEFDTELAAMFEPVMKDMDLSQDAANKLISTFAEKAAPALAQRQIDAIDNAGAELRANLARDLQNDPEVGGAKLEESKAMAGRALSNFIPNAKERSEFNEFMNQSGLGNHPLLMRVISGAGKLLSEATTAPGDVSRAEKSEADKFYG